MVNFGNFDKAYGTLGAIILTLLWFYITGLVMIIGAEMNAEIEHASPWGKELGEKARDATNSAVEKLKDAVRSARGTTPPIALLVKDNDRFRTVAIDYHDGLRYPHLQPVAGAKASLDDILRARP